MKKQKKYAIMKNNGAVIFHATSKKEAFAKFAKAGYAIAMKQIYLY